MTEVSLLLFLPNSTLLLEKGETVLPREMQQDFRSCSTQIKYESVQGRGVPECGGTGLHAGALTSSVSHSDQMLFAFPSL